MQHPLTDLARAAIQSRISTGRTIDPGTESNQPAQGVFVSLHGPPGAGGTPGALRGCRGSVHPETRTLGAEVAHQAVLSAEADPRFPPVRADEIAGLDITVYVLGPLEAVDTADELDPDRYGILIESPDGRGALLLPGIEGITDAAHQLAVTRHKAGVAPEAPIRILRFEADIYR